MQLGRHQAGNVGHIHHQPRADPVGDGAQARKIPEAGIGARPGDDELGLGFNGQALQFLVVDAFRGLTDTVVAEVIELARAVEPHPVGQVAAVVQFEAQDRVARFEQGQIDRFVGLGARVGLDVGVIGAKEPLGTFDSDLFGDVHEIATAVVAFARVPFGILVGKHAAHRRQYWSRDIVFAGDQLYPVGLSSALQLDRGIEFRVRRSQQRAWVRQFSPGRKGGFSRRHGNNTHGKNSLFRA